MSRIGIQLISILNIQNRLQLFRKLGAMLTWFHVI